MKKRGLQYFCEETCKPLVKVKTKTVKLSAFDREYELIRPAIVERDRVCRGCGAPGKEVHHIYYRSEQECTNSLLNLIYLCNKCHLLVHSDKKKYQPMLLGISWLYYTEGRRVSLTSFEACS